MAKPIKPVGKGKIMPAGPMPDSPEKAEDKKVEPELVEPEFYGIQEIPQSPMLNAFLEQSGLDYNNENEHYSEKDVYAEADAQAHEEIMLYMARRSPKSSSISDTVEHPHQIERGDLDDTTEPHERLKGYDHSLEQNRDWQSLPKPDPEPRGFQLGFRDPE
jgi:hypothetical protein